MKAVASWSGGKDSCLAVHRALDLGIEIAGLVTFVAADGRDFLAHPRDLMAKQAQAMHLPHMCLPMTNHIGKATMKGWNSFTKRSEQKR